MELVRFEEFFDDQLSITRPCIVEAMTLMRDGPPLLDTDRRRGLDNGLSNATVQPRSHMAPMQSLSGEEGKPLLGSRGRGERLAWVTWGHFTGQISPAQMLRAPAGGR